MYKIELEYSNIVNEQKIQKIEFCSVYCTKILTKI